MSGVDPVPATPDGIVLLVAVNVSTVLDAIVCSVDSVNVVELIRETRTCAVIPAPLTTIPGAITAFVADSVTVLDAEMAPLTVAVVVAISLFAL